MLGKREWEGLDEILQSLKTKKLLFPAQGIVFKLESIYFFQKRRTTNDGGRGTLEKAKEQLLDEAVKYYQEKRYEEALKACQCAISNYPTYARAFHGKGLILTKQKKYREALVAYNTACKLDQRNAKAYAERGALLYLLKEFSLSSNSYRIAIRLNKKYEEEYRKNVQKLVDEAQILYKQDYINEAINAVRNVLSFDPNNAFAKSTLPRLQNKGKWQKRNEPRPMRSYSSGKTSSSLSSRSREAIENQIWNNQWQINLSNVSPDAHPFNCRCKDCYEF